MDLMTVLGFCFSVSGLVLTIIGVAYRLSHRRLRRRRPEILVSIAVISIAWNIFVYLMLVNGHMPSFPHLYNKGIPFYYLTAPCSYYYTLLLLYPGARISRYWYLHLIPFVFGLIDIIPYTLASAQEKAQLLALVVSDIKMGFRHSYGYIEQKWHYILRFGLSAVYLVAQWRLLYIYDPRENSRFQVRWPLAISFAVIYSLQILLQGTLVMTVLSNEMQGTFLLRDINQVIWISLFFLLLTLWFCWSAWRRVRLK